MLVLDLHWVRGREYMLRVYMPGEWGRDALRELRQITAGSAELHTGSHGPEDYEMLVCGRPEREMLDVPSLRWLVIPWAGLPASIRELLEEFPHLAVHNIHHNAPAAAELAVGLLLAAAKRIVRADRNLRKGDWTIRYSPENAMLISGSRILVVGMGEIGRRVARTCIAMEANVVGIARHVKPGEVREGAPVLPPSALDGQLVEANAVVLSLPLTDETRGIMDADRLSSMRQRAVLVNVGRGTLVEEKALYEALRDGVIGAAGIDVWYSYPRGAESRTGTDPSDFPFGKLDNVVMSPHRGGAMNVAELESRRVHYLGRLIEAAAAGKPVPHSVDPELGY